MEVAVRSVIVALVLLLAAKGVSVLIPQAFKLAVNEMTQEARLYSGSSFRFFESFVVLMVAYVAITAVLSFVLSGFERKIAIPGH